MSKIWKYNSVAAFAADIENRPTLPAWEYEDVSRIESDEKTEFTGTKTFAEALSLLKYGDAESAKKITACMAADGIKDKRTITQFKPAVTGCLPHVPNYVRGVPKSMLAVNRRVIQAPTKVITLYIGTGAIARRKAGEIIRASAAIASAVCSLERSGYRVNLYACSFNSLYSGKEISLHLVKIKDAAAPLNVLNIAFPLIHPSFLRRCIFRHMEQNLEEPDLSYGRTLCAKDVKHYITDGLVVTTTDVIEKKMSASDIIASLQR